MFTHRVFHSCCTLAQQNWTQMCKLLENLPTISSSQMNLLLMVLVSLLVGTQSSLRINVVMHIHMKCTKSGDNFKMNTGYGRYGATYNMVGCTCFNEKLLLLPQNPTEAKLQATSTRGESTEPTKGVMKHTYKVVLYNYCLMQYCCILFYKLVSREGCNPNQQEKVSKSMDSSSIGNR
jgi:hypothetical protein